MSQVIILWTAIVLLLVAALVLEALIEFHADKRHPKADLLNEDQLLYCPGDHREGSLGDY